MEEENVYYRSCFTKSKCCGADILFMSSNEKGILLACNKCKKVYREVYGKLPKKKEDK